MSKLDDLRQQLTGTSTHVQILSKNNDLFVLEKVIEDSNKCQQDIDEFKELPHFCQHLPFEMKLALVGLKNIHNTPYEFGVTSLLGYANSSCQHLYDVESYKYGTIPISLFIMILLGTGGGKSTLHRELKGPLVEFEKRMFDALQHEEMRFITEEKVYKKEIKKWEDDKANGIQTPFPYPPKPIETAHYIHEKFTVNGLIDTLKTQAHLNMISAEAGVFFASHAFQNMRQDNNRSTEMTTHLTKLWDGDTISKNISNDKVRLDNRRANLLFMVQSHVIRDVLNNKMFQEQGFTHRLLMCQVDGFEKPNMSFSVEDIDRENKNRQKLQPYLNRLRQILDIRPTYVPDRDFELQPVILQTDVDARDYMAKFSNDSKTLGLTKLKSYEGFSYRLHEHCLRIAATIAVFNDHSSIKLVDAMCSVDLMNMFIEHRYKLDLGIIDTKPELTQNSLALLNFFERHKDKQFTKRDIRKNGPNSLRNISDEQFVKMLEDLVSKEEISVLDCVSENGRKVQKFGYSVATV